MLVGLLDPNYAQSPTIVDQPAASQWFGFYVKEAGIQGIVYPSVRNKIGYNLAVFPENIIGTNAKLRLLDPAAGVKSQDTFLSAENAQFQMLPSVSDSFTH